MSRNVRGPAATFRRGPGAGALMAGLVALTFMAGTAVAQTPAEPSTGRQSQSNRESCQNPANVWVGRFTSRGNGSGAGSGAALTACFPDETSCTKWLHKTSGNGRGMIVQMRCAQERKP